MENQESEFSKEEIIAYLCIIASIATVDDDVIDEKELEKIKAYCKAYNLLEAEIQEVLDFAKEKYEESASGKLEILSNSQFKNCIILELCLMAYIDGEFSDNEKDAITDIANKLGVNNEALNGTYELAEFIYEKSKQGDSWYQIKQKLAQLVGAGAGITAVVAGGSVAGASAAGITSGLAALGSSFAILGLSPMLAGLGVVAAIGAGTGYVVAKGAPVVAKGVSDGASKMSDIVLEITPKVSEVVSSGASKTWDVVSSGTSKAWDVVSVSSPKVSEAVSSGASKTWDVVSSGTSKVWKGVVKGTVKVQELAPDIEQVANVASKIIDVVEVFEPKVKKVKHIKTAISFIGKMSEASNKLKK